MAKVQIPDAFKFLFVPRRYKGAYGGRGGAKSHSFATAALIMGRQKKLTFMCCREVQNSIKESVKRLLDTKIEEMEMHNFFKSTNTEINGKNGTRFLFNGLRTNVDAIRSTEDIDVAWVEEANRTSQRSLDLLIPTVRKPNSEIWFSWNPESPKDPVDKMMREDGKGRPDILCNHINYDKNPWFPQVLRDEMEWDRRRDPDKYAWVWLGDYVRNSEARVFHNYVVEDFNTPQNARFFYGADWGYSIDPTVCVRMFIDQRTLYIDQEVYKIGCEIEDTPELFDRIPGTRKWKIIADSARPETISFMKRKGFNIVGSVKGAKSVDEGIKFLQTFDIKIHPRCRHVYEEFTSYSYKIDKQTDEVLPLLAQKKNHTIDACRYALENQRRSRYGMLEVA